MVKGPQAEQVLVIEIESEGGWKAIGNTSLMGIEWTSRLAEVGLFIGEKQLWNQGYGRETVQLMLKYAFETLNMNRVWLRVYEHNLRGIKAYERAGFVHEGRLRQAIYSDGRYYDVLIMSVLHSEWVSGQAVENK
jgi:RimJ/RimL family protein N-acetyltransferase